MKHHKHYTLSDKGFCNMPAMGLPAWAAVVAPTRGIQVLSRGSL
jgi:hypothetical protein